MGHRTDASTQLLLLHSVRMGLFVVVLAVSLRFLPLGLRNESADGEIKTTINTTRIRHVGNNVVRIYRCVCKIGYHLLHVLRGI